MLLVMCGCSLFLLFGAVLVLFVVAGGVLFCAAGVGCCVLFVGDRSFLVVACNVAVGRLRFVVVDCCVMCAVICQCALALFAVYCVMFVVCCCIVFAV